MHVCVHIDILSITMFDIESYIQNVGGKIWIAQNWAYTG